MVLFLGIGRFTRVKLDGFLRRKIESNFSYDPNFPSPPLSTNERTQIKGILNQKYTYLGRGAQFYAFASEDGKYVLKFFRIPHIAPSLWTQISWPFFQDKRTKKIAQFERRRVRDYTSCQIAFDHMKTETGLLFLHLNKTDDLEQKVRIYDKIGVEHVLDIDRYEFLIQERAEPLYPIIKQYIAKGELDNAKKMVDQIVSFLVDRCKRGISDTNPNLRTNFGIVGERIIQFDIGRYDLDPKEASPEIYCDELVRITYNFKEWLEKRSPVLADHLHEKVLDLYVE